MGKNKKIILIKENEHKSNKRFFKPFIFLRKSKTISYKVIFDKSCVYDINDNQEQINKLFGFSIGLNHHNNSIRIGWRYNILNDNIELFSYIYQNGTRIEELITTVKLDVEIRIKISYHKKKYAEIYLWNSDIISTEEIPFFIHKIYNLSGIKKYFFGYYLFPYFGGVIKAPHNIKLTLTKL